MKTIKNGLVAVALATALTGCGGATLRDLTERDTPYESITIKGAGECKEEYIFMSPSGYNIVCNKGWGDEFIYNNRGYYFPAVSRLTSNGVSYEDSNSDGVVDVMSVSGEDIPVGPDHVNLQAEYHEILNRLQQPRIHNIWEGRWGRSD